MRTLRPARVSVLARVAAVGPVERFVVTALAWADLAPSEATGSPRPALGFEQELWEALAPHMAPVPLDVGLPKPRGEYLVLGDACAPGGAPAEAVLAGVRLHVKGGVLEKELAVFGDRELRAGGPSAPVPFERMPLCWERAYGGEGFARNPLGKGHREGVPNVEARAERFHARGQGLAPAGFGPLDPSWEPRRALAGTYDAAWLSSRAPASPLDWHVDALLAAPPDQRLREGFFAGDEAFELWGLHPSGRQRGRLPGVRARVLAGAEEGGRVRLAELPSALETLIFLPNVGRVALLFRATGEREPAHLVVGLEALGAPKPLEAYEDAATARLDRRKAGMALLRDAELMPAWPELGQSGWLRAAKVGDAIAPSRRQARLEKVTRRVEEDVHAAMGREAPPPRPAKAPLGWDEIEAKLASVDGEVQAAKARAEEVRKEAEARAGGAPAAQRRPGPPKLEGLEELQRAQPELGEALVRKQGAALEKAREVYRRHGHHGAPSGLAPDAAEKRERVLAARRAGRSLRGEDLTGADLRELDLSGLDLTEAFLEGASLERARAHGAKLAGAMLAHADLSGADLAGATLAGANLGGADLSDAQLGEGAALEGVVLHRARLHRASLRGAKLPKAQLHETAGRGVDLRGADLGQALFLDADLEEARLDGARLERAVFLRTKLQRARLDGASLVRACLIEADATGASFDGAELTKLVAVKGAALEGASFREARLAQACLRGARLARARFDGALASGADLSGCDLREAVLRGAVLDGAMALDADLSGADLGETNLMASLLHRARLDDASLERANLFRADLGGARGERARFTGALVARTRAPERRA